MSINMNPVSDTAYYCCGVRMQDAQRARSFCGDAYAKVFMDERGMKIFDKFKHLTLSNVNNISRCLIIDDAVRQRLTKDSGLTIISIGAGFDTRPYRLKGGHWIELDEPQIIDHKNEKLPVSQCSNALTRIAINFANESLSDKLAFLDGNKPVLIIIEGVIMYLEQPAVAKTIAEITAKFPDHDVICDLMPRRFFDKYASKSIHKLIQELGASFATLPEVPRKVFLDNGYQLMGVVPTYQYAHEIGAFKELLKLPRFASGFMLNVLMPDLKDYAVHEFKFKGAR
ncbi:MAG: class I SAM-dependent methyltransferase [Aquabacterium sp.]|uniref:class I SAM-dependent methyltransferase n=1 Tax=Aquabacterium sp. TaxID=1872578 RepID=UPI0027212600|nr:class I SAM-dependent methyltransferase [Aquabacterium sp.]MDO9005934.1 class I SAM-dependent methyltransferase [Aquabacterium sp.]